MVADDLFWICFGISLFFNVVLTMMYMRLLRQKKQISSFKVDMLNTIFYRDLTNNKQNKQNK